MQPTNHTVTIINRLEIESNGETLSMDNSLFEVGHAYERREIYRRLGGDLVSTFPKRAGHIIYCCISQYVNPDAPEIILVGRQLLVSARQLVSQQEAIPVFMRQGVRRTEMLVYQGKFVAEQFSENRKIIMPYAHRAYRADVIAILFLRRAE